MNAPWTLPQKPGSAVFDEGARSLKTLPKGSVQGAHLGARSLNAPLGSAIQERVREGGGGGGGGAPPQHRFGPTLYFAIGISPPLRGLIM
jgi:hypothetical protein